MWNSINYTKINCFCFSSLVIINFSNINIEDYKIRQKEVKNTCNKIRELKDTFIKHSPFISGVGTGCFDLEVNEEVYDEIQVGSYAFMDAHYSSLKHDRKFNNTNNFESGLSATLGFDYKILGKEKEFNLSIDEIEIVKEDITFEVPGKLN